MIDSSHESEHYRRTLEAEPVLQSIELVVDLICEKGLPCNETWSKMVKTLTIPYLGVLRGYGVKNADNLSRPDRTTGEILTDLLADLDDTGDEAKRMDKYRHPATNSTEEWLRSSEAWDAVTQVWIRRLHDADPADERH